MIDYIYIVMRENYNTLYIAIRGNYIMDLTSASRFFRSS